MATVPIAIDDAGHSCVAVGMDYSWDGAPLVMGSQAKSVAPATRFPA